MSSALVHAQTGELATVLTHEQVELLKRTICKGATDDELALFRGICDRTRLDPFARQIYAIKRWDSQLKREVMSAQASIDGFRLVAQRSGEYEGQVGPHWCGADGGWREIWLDSEPPRAARVGVWRRGFRDPCYGIALWDEYAQTKRDGGLTAMWQRMPALMLAKCAESLALRKAFPQELSGLYTVDEMAQATPEATAPALAPGVDVPPSDDPDAPASKDDVGKLKIAASRRAAALLGKSASKEDVLALTREIAVAARAAAGLENGTTPAWSVPLLLSAIERAELREGEGVVIEAPAAGSPEAQAAAFA